MGDTIRLSQQSSRQASILTKNMLCFTVTDNVGYFRTSGTTGKSTVTPQSAAGMPRLPAEIMFDNGPLSG